MKANKSSVSFRLYGEELFPIFFVAATFKLLQNKTNRIETNQSKSDRVSREVRKPGNFVGFQNFVVKPLFLFVSFIGPFTKKGAILCFELML